MPEREYFSQSNIKPLWTHRAIALSQSIYGLSMFFQCCCDVQNLHVSPQEESRKYFIFGSVPLVRRVRVTALESSHWSQNVIWDFMINDFHHVVKVITQWPVSHGLGQNFDGGAGSRCPAVFSTGYGAHQGKKPGVLGAHAFFVLGTVPIKKKTSSGKTSSKQTLQGSSWTVQS